MRASFACMVILIVSVLAIPSAFATPNHCILSKYSTLCSSGGYSHGKPGEIMTSFGGTGGNIFHDGLKINGNIFDISHYTQTIPKQALPVGHDLIIRIKEVPYYGYDHYQRTTLFLNFGGQDLETYNARTVIYDDKLGGTVVTDPDGFLKDVTTSRTNTDDYTWVTFHFKAAKAMPDTSMIIQAWDDYKRVVTAKVYGAIQFGLDNPPTPKVELPSWVHVFYNAMATNDFLRNNDYKRPSMMSHISTADQLGTGLTVKWVFDEHKETLTRIIYSQGNEVNSLEEHLKKQYHSLFMNY